MGPSATRSDLLPLPADDAVIVFRTERSGVNGRLVRLGPVAEKIIRMHGLPEAASAALGEAISLAALLGSAQTSGGTISVQTKTNGAISVLYADCQSSGNGSSGNESSGNESSGNEAPGNTLPGRLRGYARFDAGAVAALSEAGRRSGARLGDGHLAITIDQAQVQDRPDERYQGIIALDDVPLAVAAAAYFEQRESLPTFLRLAAAEHYAGAHAGLPVAMRWRAGGMMIQHVAATAATGADVDAWARVRMLTATIEDHELLDPLLSPERLLLRLFHEEGVVIERVVPMTTYCKCSREKVSSVLTTFGPDELSDMRDENGKIAVKCEFCAATYAFELSDIAP